MTNKEIVINRYEQANCVKVAENAYYICMFQENPFFETPIAFSKLSEEHAWEIAAHHVLNNIQ